MKARTVAIANQKGGVGKTTTAHAMATGLAYRGHKTLAVDADPQGNLTFTMGASPGMPGVYELMAGSAAPRDAIQRTWQGDIIPGSLMLAGADMEFAGAGREHMLRDVLEPLRAAYDYIVIDSPPTLGMLTINALTAAHDLIVPLGADAYSLQGFSQLHATIGRVREHCNPSLRVAGLLITRHAGRTVLARDMKDVIAGKARAAGTRAFDAVIREGVAVREAQLRQSSLYAAAAKSSAAADYLAFVDEYLKGAAGHA